MDRFSGDPRIEAAKLMTSEIRRILCFVSGKGGVGKSILSSLSALLFSSSGKKVGILDLDFHGPSVHTVLGATVTFKEDRGIVPNEFRGIKIMSIIPFAGERPILWRGKDVSEAILELLAIVRWGYLDFLILDMPPGTGEEILETARFLPKREFVVITTPSRLSIETVTRLIKALHRLRVDVIGMIENMGDGRIGKKLAEDTRTKFLGAVRYDSRLEKAIGNPDKLLETGVATDLRKIWRDWC